MMTAEEGERERERAAMVMTYVSVQYLLSWYVMSCYVMPCHTFIKQKRQQDELDGTGDGYKAIFLNRVESIQRKRALELS
jgi:hypothetical protein